MGRLKTGLKLGADLGLGMIPGNPKGALDQINRARKPSPQQDLLASLHNPEVVEAIEDIFRGALPRLLDEEPVQQELAPFIVEVLKVAMGSPGPQSDTTDFQAEEAVTILPPENEWPYSILYIAKLEERIEKSEGKDLEYHEVDGKVHVGIGHCTENDGIPDHLQQVGMRITEEMCADLFEDDLQEAYSRARRACQKHGVDAVNLPNPVFAGLVNMMFQMGYKPAYWTKMWGHIKRGDYAEAARESLRSGQVEGKPSAWWLQTRNRAAVVAPMLANKQLWFQVGPKTTFGDGTKGHEIIEHPWNSDAT